MKYQIYEYDYQPYQEAAGEKYNTIEQAAAVLLDDIITDEWPYMIGTDEGIEAFVFQGRVYREQINETAKGRGVTTKEMICSEYLEGE